jgi:tRNA uridine 5-carboxymethylaminomethyl modification enzyme
VDDERWKAFSNKKEAVEREVRRLSSTRVHPHEKEKLNTLGIASLPRQFTLEELLKRPEVSYEMISSLDGCRNLSVDEAEQVELRVKYEGYIKRQMAQVEQARRLEDKAIPDEVDFTVIRALSRESQEKLQRIRPKSLGQASRIPGVTPADVAVLTVHLEQLRRRRAEQV